MTASTLALSLSRIGAGKDVPQHAYADHNIRTLP